MERNRKRHVPSDYQYNERKRFRGGCQRYTQDYFSDDILRSEQPVAKSFLPILGSSYGNHYADHDRNSGIERRMPPAILWHQEMYELDKRNQEESLEKEREKLRRNRNSLRDGFKSSKRTCIGLQNTRSDMCKDRTSTTLQINLLQLKGHKSCEDFSRQVVFSKRPQVEKKVKRSRQTFRKKRTHFQSTKQVKHLYKAKQHSTTSAATPNSLESTTVSGIERNVKCMSFLRLQRLTETNKNEILLTILDNESGFCLLLEQKVERDYMAHILLALGKAVTSNLRSNVIKLFHLIIIQNNLFLISVQQYLASFYQTYKSEEYHLDSLVSLTTFLYEFQINFPSNSLDTLLIVLPLLKQTSEKCLLDYTDVSGVSNKLQEMEEKNKVFLQKHKVCEMKQISHNEKLQQMSPPENYRSIPILPTIEDIYQPCPFLRPNKVKGPYQDTEHYLDVQFRLLREDYVKPLRDGITEYLELKKHGKSAKHCKDAKVYTNVYIMNHEFINGQLVHMASFRDKRFSKIKWEYSKRFLSGSLLCFSSDDFKSMMFAVVARRDPEKLSQGLLLLRFEELTDEVLNITVETNFTVIETSAYFEAYRHNLNALLHLGEEFSPLKRYIVDVQKDVQKPAYLDDNVKYDMCPLFLPLGYIEGGNDAQSYFSINKSYPAHIPEKAKAVNIFDDKSWPSHSELNLDISQYEALKAAVTKEFAIIQGPPGTGKTFVGLRIAQLLLHNVYNWHKSKEQLPILVICYTNHALDQFLEGLLLFTNQVVRIGGRGKNEAISKYQLNNLKSKIKERRQVPHYIFHSIRQKRMELEDLKKRIRRIRSSIERSLKFALSEDELERFMLPEHYSSLKFIGNFRVDDGFLTLDWLKLRFSDEGPTENVPLKKHLLNSREKNHSIQWDEDYSEGEDIEYMEAQRDFGFDEFAEASYNLPISESDEILNSKNEWHQENKEKNITWNLRNHQTFPENIVKEIRDVWELGKEHRWCLYKYWIESYIKTKEVEALALQQELRERYKEMCEMQIEEDIHVCKQALIVGMTTTGAAKYRHIVQYLNPKVLIVEEAAEIFESHIVTSLAPGTEHVILIGDHQQLRPSPAVHSLAVKYDLNVSLFQRMIENDLKCYKLGIQHRMRPEIAALLVPHIYRDLKNHDSVEKYESIKGVGKNVFFITHTKKELQQNDSKSKVNQHEAKYLLKLCKYLLLQGYEPSQITILAAYSGQFFEMKKLGGLDTLKGVKFTVVDNYQGEENDIILISFVRSNDDGQIGFLKTSNRVCVALSRAKKGLYCIGNFTMLAEKSDLWKNIILQLEKDGSIGTSLQLFCSNHPRTSYWVSSEADFESVPDGGCGLKCEFRLSCGHVCSLPCHPYDIEHNDIKCLKPCTKLCEDGHLCTKKCFEECGPCKHLINKTLSRCQHTNEVFCFLKDKNISCTKLCKKVLPCGHMCTNLCSHSCVSLCTKNVQVKSKVCGHSVKIACIDKNNKDLLSRYCTEPCGFELACGHICVGKCNMCHQGRLHIACHKPCKRILVCGHECKSPCSKSCPPCKDRCQNKCIHSKCPMKCGVPCAMCIEPCEWACPHKKCNRLCGEPCDRTACDEPCKKLLKCQHPCIGLCGEPCPKDCRVCDEENVKEIFFGSEDEPNARFVILKDCNHVFEVNAITQWMNQDCTEKREVQMKSCPKCKKVIRNNLRFGNIIKSCLAGIEKVKKITYGNRKNNLQMQKQLYVKLGGHASKWYCSPLVKALRSEKRYNIQELSTMENVINIILTLVPDDETSNKEALVGDLNTTKEDLVLRLKSYIHSSRQYPIMVFCTKYASASEQQLQELTWEVQRLKLATKILNLIQTQFKMNHKEHVEKILEIVLTYAPFRKKDSDLFAKEFTNFVKLIGGAEINVSDLEKQSILKAMGFKRGHWYQCPNGHVYCITECGGAMQESKCNECGEKIGGSSHRILSSNRVATAMDGAQHSAWSDAMNMENYRF